MYNLSFYDMFQNLIQHELIRLLSLSMQLEWFTFSKDALTVVWKNEQAIPALLQFMEGVKGSNSTFRFKEEKSPKDSTKERSYMWEEEIAVYFYGKTSTQKHPRWDTRMIRTHIIRARLITKISMDIHIIVHPTMNIRHLNSNGRRISIVPMSFQRSTMGSSCLPLGSHIHW